jgi:16S rRNA (guanine527-N7)-methyltransferase
MTNTVVDRLEMLNNATGKNVSRETLAILDEYVDLLLKWNNKINLVSKTISCEVLWERHICDSAQLVKYIPASCSKILDFGSGAGLPGLIMAIIGAYKVSLVESDQRKCAFMQVIASRFALPVNILSVRIEDLPLSDCDVITSRALAPVRGLLEYSSRHLKNNNFMLLLKGKNVLEEIEDARLDWDFDYRLSKVCESGGNVLEIFNTQRKVKNAYNK